MNKDLVSVVVPIYNGEKYLYECVVSVIEQTYANLEIILVDDGSQDNSRNICIKLKDIDKRIKTVFKEKNGGVSECRLSGLSVSTGKWLIFVDHDDTIPNDCIRTFLNIAKIDNDIEVVCGNVAESYQRKIGEDDIPVIDSGINIVKRYFDDPQIKTSHESKLYKMEFLLKANVAKFRERCPAAFFDDIVITPILLGEAKKVAILPGVYYLHREVMSSISRSNLLNSFMYDHMEAGDIMLQYFRKRHCERSYSHKLSRYFRDILRIYCLMDYFDLESEIREEYAKRILKYFKKYKKDYIRRADENIVLKFIFLLFDISPCLWKKVIQHTYYKGYKEEHNL